VVVVSMHADPRFVFEALEAGAQGYLVKDSAAEELLAAVRCVADGKRYLSAGISDIVIRDYLHLKRGDRSPAYALLSARERQVLQLLAEGRPTKDIASLCNVSAKTIETHRQNIMEKVGVKSIAELTKYAVREGLTSL
jgi:DNA-binding NarL/FixJ family response regulator